MINKWLMLTKEKPLVAMLKDKNKPKKREKSKQGHQKIQTAGKIKHHSFSSTKSLDK